LFSHSLPPYYLIVVGASAKRNALIEFNHGASRFADAPRAKFPSLI
jgi:hypothetical protein